MSDPIERQDVIDELKKLSFSLWFECGEYLSEDTREIEIINSNKALEAIETLPSVQPYTDEQIQKMQEMHQAEIEKAFALGQEDVRAEIIHCGECKHKGTKNCVANVWAAILGVTVKDDFYCGLAERRTDG